MVVVIVCLMVVTMLSVALVRTLVAQHWQIQLVERQLQVMWLSQAATERARARLSLAARDESAEPYDGETWEIPAD